MRQSFRRTTRGFSSGRRRSSLTEGSASSPTLTYGAIFFLMLAVPFRYGNPSMGTLYGFTSMLLEGSASPPTLTYEERFFSRALPLFTVAIDLCRHVHVFVFLRGGRSRVLASLRSYGALARSMSLYSREDFLTPCVGTQTKLHSLFLHFLCAFPCTCVPLPPTPTPNSLSLGAPRRSKTFAFPFTKPQDTIKDTNILNKTDALLNSFVRPFRPIPGMAEMYNRWNRRSNTAFHYVSGSPVELNVCEIWDSHQRMGIKL